MSESRQERKSDTLENGTAKWIEQVFDYSGDYPHGENYAPKTITDWMNELEVTYDWVFVAHLVPLEPNRVLVIAEAHQQKVDVGAQRDES